MRNDHLEKRRDKKTEAQSNGKRVIYLACPYTHPDQAVRAARFHAATRAAAALISQGNIVYSPITMTHPIDLVLGGSETLGSEYWVTFDEAFMDFCSELYVLTLDGWDKSPGIAREIEYFQRQRKPIYFISPSK
jgi:hypothetical protein